MKFLALDLGTSFLKGAVIDLARAEISHVARTPFPPNLTGLPPRHVEVDPAAIIRATQTLLDQLAAQAPDASGVMVTSQMHGIVLTDARGKALTNAVTWQDQRALDPVDGGEGNVYDGYLTRIAPDAVTAIGNVLKPSLPLFTLAWWAEHGMLPGGAVPASLPDYVLGVMSGAPAIAEPTMAGSMGMFDLTTGDWHAGILREFSLEGLTWPRLVDVRDASYTLTVGGRTLPCYAPVGDHQCALVGALLQQGELSLNISTGSQLGAISPTYVPGNYETRPYFDMGYLQTITRLPAGRALTALVGLLTALPQAEGYSVRDPWATIATAVEATPKTEIEANISFFASIVGDRGALMNLTEENLQIGHLFRAAFQAMARNYQLCAGELAPPEPLTRIVFSGGLAQRFGPLRDEITARLQLPYRLCPTSEDTLLGLLALARVATGAAPTVAASVAQLADETVTVRE
jgi:sugar (pentulose or hexulose) kinase